MPRDIAERQAAMARLVGSLGSSEWRVTRHNLESVGRSLVTSSNGEVHKVDTESERLVQQSYVYNL